MTTLTQSYLPNTSLMKTLLKKPHQEQLMSPKFKVDEKLLQMSKKRTQRTNSQRIVLDIGVAQVKRK